MLIWCLTLFCLGIIAFMDSIFNYGDIFRRINSIVFMLVSLGLLIRTSIMFKTGYRENKPAVRENRDSGAIDRDQIATREERSAAVTS